MVERGDGGRTFRMAVRIATLTLLLFASNASTTILTKDGSIDLSEHASRGGGMSRSITMLVLCYRVWALVRRGI